MLSLREQDILDFLYEGLENGEIGLELHLAEDTVKTHVRRILRKFGVSSRAGAAASGILQGYGRVPMISLDLLTDREREVMACIAEGLSNKSIGVELELSEQTIKGHVSKILRKLGLSRRSALAAAYAQVLLLA